MNTVFEDSIAPTPLNTLAKMMPQTPKKVRVKRPHQHGGMPRRNLRYAFEEVMDASEEDY